MDDHLEVFILTEGETVECSNCLENLTEGCEVWRDLNAHDFCSPMCCEQYWQQEKAALEEDRALEDRHDRWFYIDPEVSSGRVLYLHGPRIRADGPSPLL
jgi:hypothetical protein